MYIGRIGLNGFKSFGGVHELPLEMGMVAIVGPNGSGKSNILDALKWTLGEGSPSRLRINRQSDLLFQGSASLPPAKEAEVSVLFRGDGMSTSISRRVQQDGTTAVFVDGVRRTLAELEEAKRRIHMEGDRFAFIGQGEVSEVIQQRPMARRMLLESLLGIDFYRKRRNESSDRLKEVSEDLGRLMAFYGELSSRRREISQEVERARRAREIQSELEGLHRDHYWWRRSSLEARLSEVRSALESLTAQREMRARWLKVWREAASGLDSKGRELDLALGGARAAMEDLERRMEEWRRRCFSLGTMVMEARRSGAEVARERDSLLEALASAHEELRQATEQLASAQGEVEALRSQEASSRGRLQDLEERVRSNQSRLERIRQEEARAKEALSSSMASLKALGVQRLDALKGLRGLESALEEARGRLMQERARLDQAEEGAQRANSLHRQALAEFQAGAERLQSLKRQLAKVRSSVDELEETLELQVLPKPVQGIVSAARLGKVRAKPTVLMDAFRCPKEISGAVEAFLGGRQFWLLVDTLEESGECIAFLKSRSLGRATFLPLERCVPRRPDRANLRSAPGVVGFAMDLIEADSRYERALQHLMGDLLVVRDYDSGKEVARSSFRGPIVTLEGDVFQPTGAVSGGQSRSQRSAMEIRCALEEGRGRLSELETRVEEESKALKALEEAESRLASESREAIADLSVVRSRVEEAASEVQRLERDHQRLRDVIEDLNRRMSQEGRRVLELRAPRDPGEGEDLEELKSQLESLREAHREASMRLALGEERLSGARALVDRMAAEMDRLKGRLAQLEASTSDRDGRLASALGELRGLGVRWLEAWRKLSELRARRDQVMEASTDLRGRLERVRGRMASAMEALGGVDMALEGLSREEGALCRELEELISSHEESYPYPSVVPPIQGEGLRQRIRELERALREMGPVDMGVLSESRSLDERMEFLKDQMEDLRRAMGELERLIAEADHRAQTVFMGSLRDIDHRFDSLFKRLFGGGEARLELMEGAGPWDAGVEITARPPGKKPQGISQLSGGEQSLTAVALLFASLEVAGCPMAVLDEVDAALDEVNLRRFADLAAESAEERQILVMTHRRITMERARLLYGVTLREPGLSQVVGVRLEDWD